MARRCAYGGYSSQTWRTFIPDATEGELRDVLPEHDAVGGSCLNVRHLCESHANRTKARTCAIWLRRHLGHQRRIWVIAWANDTSARTFSNDNSSLRVARPG